MFAHHLPASCHIIHNPILMSTLLHDSGSCVNQTLGKMGNTLHYPPRLIFNIYLISLFLPLPPSSSLSLSFSLSLFFLSHMI